MMEVQKQWVNVDGKWQHQEVPQTAQMPQLPQRPALPSRTATSSSQQALSQQQPPTLPTRPPSRAPPPALPSRPATKSPALPPRRPSETPSAHSRRPSDMIVSKRDSNESIRSTATADTTLSALSNGTSFTSSSDRYTIRAPEYDPAMLPKLPPKRTQEEKDAAARAARFPKSRKSSTTIPRSEAPAVKPPERPQSIPPPSQPTIGNLPTGVEAETPAGPKQILPGQPLLPKGVPAGARQMIPFRKADIIEQEQEDRIAPALPKRSPLPPPVEEEQAPALPKRNANTQPTLPKRQVVPPPAPVRRSPLEMGFGNKEVAPSLPTRPAPSNGNPPPIPTASRPDLAALQASKPKLNGAQSQPAAAPSACLLCRDFSGPDSHAARFPRQSLPSQDLGWLAQQLTAPFPSATDKARVIFTWLHHNVEYDTVAFFNNNVQPSTPQSTLATGLAVCEGYAALFSTLALKSGLEAVVVSGHGKGYGHSPLQPGAPIPPYDAGHAWNAVKIDGGVWKLIDPCWGAGNVNGKGQPYNKQFSPVHFIKSNEDFGLSHYPGDASRQYRSDGRIMSWEEYMRVDKYGTAATVWNGYTTEEGISDISFKPVANPIVLSQQGPSVRFSFQKVCPHWDPIRCGQGQWYLYVLHTEGLDGTQRNHIPFQQGDGIWWLDVPVADLGRPGQKASIYTVTEYDKKPARGLTIEQYHARKGRVAMMFGGVAQWTMA